MSEPAKVEPNAAADCVFCRIGARQLEAMVVYEDPEIIAFRDINPQAPAHVLISPKRHYATLYEFQQQDPALLGRLLAAALQIGQQERLAARGFRLVLNHGAEGGQSVQHVHLHLLGGRPFNWPPG